MKHETEKTNVFNLQIKRAYTKQKPSVFHFSQIASIILIPLNGFKQRLEVTGTKTLRTKSEGKKSELQTFTQPDAFIRVQIVKPPIVDPPR